MIHAKKYWLVVIIVFCLFMFVKPALCPIMIGSLVLYMGVAAIVYLQYIKKQGIKCTGTILEYESDNDGYKTPVVEFTTWSGDTFTEKPYVHASTDLDKILTYKSTLNQPIPILYDPKAPSKFVVANEEGFNYFVFIVFILIGLVFIGLGICELLGYIHFS